MRIVPIVVLLIAAATQAVAQDIRVLIAPRSVVVPQSGKVLVDIYWINRGSRSAVIPGAGVCSFSYSPVDATSNWGSADIHVFNHRPPDRQIPPRAIGRDTTTAELEFRGAKLLEVTGRFLGHRVEFESNSVVVRPSR